MLPRPTLLSGACILGLLMAQGARAEQAEPAAEPAISADGRAITGLDAAQLFDLASQAQLAGRIDDAEAIYKALSQDPQVEIRSEARFRLGMMYAEATRYEDAAVTFRQLLDEQPQAARVRLELARVLALMGDEGRARQQIRQAQATGLPADVAQVVDRFATALRSRKMFGGSFEFAMAPDSNINRATDSKTLDTVIAPLTLSDDARSQSGLGAHLSGQVYARVALSPKLNLVPRMSGDGTFYKQDQFNDLSGSALLGLEWQIGRDRFVPSVGATWRYYGGDPYARTGTVDLRWTHPMGRRTQMDTSLSWANTSYQRNSLQDGNLWSVGVSVERALTARTGVGFSLNGQRQSAQDPGYSTTSGGVTLIGWRDMGKVTLFSNATVRRLESDARIFPFPDRRKEWYLRGLVGATFRQIEVAGFSPVVRMAYERNFSTVGIYDYRRFNVDVGITRAF